ncbi:MAG: hypothetical protein MSH62_01940, partial [Enorma burkinafasonensis]|nr:hypothetical protein [Enorma burkinafasonensis]
MEIKLFKGKRPAVVAGMIATAGLGMALTAAPAVAAADELPRDGQAPAVEQGTLPSGAGSSDQVASGSLPDGSQGSDAVEPGGDATGSGSVAGNGEQGDPEQSGGETGNAPRPGDGGQTGSGEQGGSEVPGGETAAGNEEQGEGGQPSDDIASVEPDAPAESDDVLANEVLTVEDEADQTDVELPTIGWTGNSYWDGTTDEHGNAVQYTGWVVDDHAGTGLQRYFVENGVVKADSVFQQVLAGVESWFYAQADGTILRGVGYKDGSPLIADNDGRLAEGWVVTDRFGQGLQRYWFIDGELASEGVHSTGGGSWTYVTDQGYVLRGKKDDYRGHVYLADNDGNLAALGADGCGSGWLVTGLYDGGGLQRYYIDGKAHAAVSGYFNVDASGVLHGEGGPGESYFGLGGEGYVLRGAGRGVRSDWLYADNDGKLARDEWVVTDAFGQGLQRYWFDGTTIAGEGLYDTGGGWWTYVTDQGYVLRGKKDDYRGHVYLADNDGRLVSGDGWLVTGLYDGGALQRYYIDGAAHAAVSGFFTAELAGKTGGFFGLAGHGYVMRGATPWGNIMLIANNDGFLVTNQGHSITANHSSGKDYSGNWLVTDEFAGGLQRYFITDAYSDASGDYFGALIGKFAIGKNAEGDPIEYYGRNDTGYVVRGSYRAPDGTYYYANNDGVLDNFVMLDGGQLTEVGRRIWDAIMNKSSNTQYLIAVDRIACRTVVFQGSAGNWKPIYDWGCATGNPKYNSGNGTIVGEFQIGGQPGSWADHRWTG